MKRYNLAISGGTFDYFHAGHKAFLTYQAMHAEHVLLGITSDTYTDSFKKQNRTPFQKRKEEVVSFLTSEHIDSVFEIASIDDGGIPVFWEEKPIDVLFVTENTQKMADEINNKRKQQGKSALEVEVIPHVLAYDGIPISSERIRNGKINREGKAYIRDEWYTHTLTLPFFLREDIKKPFGKVYQSLDDWLHLCIPSGHVITVGDVISEVLMKQGFGQKVSIIDLLVQRQRQYRFFSDHTITGDESIISLENKAGTISPDLIHATKKALVSKDRSIICVTGEEDLAVLPCILLCPLSYHVLYGQPGEGFVDIEVTEQVKNNAKDLLEKFES